MAEYDLVVVGLGAGGRTAAEFAAGLGLRVAAVERARPGGSSLWTGSVPSKAIVASANVAHTMRTAHRLGITAVKPVIDLATVWRRTRAVQAEIAAADGPRRSTEMGVTVLFGSARLATATSVVVTAPDGSEQVLDTKFVLLCTGSRPALPRIEGLDPERCLTSDNLFVQDAPPPSLAIIGGGPLGTEMAQALHRLGVTITLFERLPMLLAGEEPALVERLTDALVAEGVRIHCSADIRAIDHHPDGTATVQAITGDVGERVTIEVGGVLVAAGRTPNVHGLGLDEAGVSYTDAGILVDDRGRTDQRTVYAAGDVTADPAIARRLATAAAFNAVQAVRDMFFPGRSNVDRTMPWCTFTDPELARVGLTVAEAEELHGTDADAWQLELPRLDRARTDGCTDGSIVIVTAKSRIVGAHVLAPGAGEIIHELALAVREGLRVDELAGLVHTYPTYASGVGQLAVDAAFEKAQRLKWMIKKR
ncbi:MAG: FAD-dependent oxidoreductase [Actinomycetota bacterium]|nr:FAD-dependent oxidoreductase [Actinomycetota bacterium]